MPCWQKWIITGDLSVLPRERETGFKRRVLLKMALVRSGRATQARGLPCCQLSSSSSRALLQQPCGSLGLCAGQGASQRDGLWVFFFILPLAWLPNEHTATKPTQSCCCSRTGPKKQQRPQSQTATGTGERPRSAPKPGAGTPGGPNLAASGLGGLGEGRSRSLSSSRGRRDSAPARPRRPRVRTLLVLQ